MSESLEEKVPRKLGQRVVHNLLWAFSSAAARMMLHTVVVAVLARLLMPHDFGVVAAALIVVRFSNLMSQLGVGAAIVQRPELRPEHVRTAITISVLFGVLLAASVWLLAAPISAVLRMEELQAVLQVVALVFPIQAASVVAEAILQREMKFRRIAFAELTADVLGYATVGIALAWAGYGLWALIGAILAQVMLRTILMVAARPHALLPRFDRRAAGELLGFGTGQTGGRIAVYLANQVGNLVIGRWLGASALGIYSRAHQITIASASTFSSTRDKVLFSAMVTMQSDSGRLGNAYRRGLTINAVMVLPLSVVLCILAPEVVAVLFGPKWSDMVLPARILSLGILLQCGHRLSDSVIRASGRVYRAAWRQGLSVLLVAGGAWVGQRWGIAGASLGIIAAFAVHYLVMAHLTLSITGGTWASFAAAHFPSLGLTALLGLVAWAVAGLLRGWHLPPALVLPGTLLATGLALLPAIYRPRLLLGEDGQRAVDYLRSRLRGGRKPSPTSPPVVGGGSTDGLARLDVPYESPVHAST